MIQPRIYLNIISISILTSQWADVIRNIKPNQLTLFKDIITVYCNNHTKYINMYCSKMQSLAVLTQRTVGPKSSVELFLRGLIL
jgi:hypothetical protein